jgi:hypothetical protein
MLVDQHFALQGKLTLLIYRLPSMNEIETMNTIARRYRIEDFQVVQVELENLADTSLPTSASERWLVMADRKGKFPINSLLVPFLTIFLWMKKGR